MNWKVLSLMSFTLLSCTPSARDKKLIEENKFEAIYVELLDSAALSSSATADSALSPTAQRILERNDVSVDQFKATVAYYNADTKRWEQFFTNVAKRIGGPPIDKQ